MEIRSLFAGYGKKEILHNISLNFEKGEITTIIGPNGSGKSTLLKSVIGLADVHGGEILSDGILTKNISRSELAQKIAYLAQGKNVPDITVGNLVLHGRFPYLSFPRKYRKADTEKANTAMQKAGILHLKDTNLFALSGGMRQKAYIAMALCQEADTILLDEPITYLDISQQFKLSDILNELKESKKTVVCVLHDIILSLKISDKIIIMENGAVKAVGSPLQILESGVIPKVFGIEIVSAEHGGNTEYFYSQRKDLK